MFEYYSTHSFDYKLVGIITSLRINFIFDLSPLGLFRFRFILFRRQGTKMMTTSILPLVLVNEWLVSWHEDHCLSALYSLH